MPTWLRMVLVTASVAGGSTGSVVCTVAVAPAALPPSSRPIAAAFAALYAFVVAAGLLVVHNPAARLARNEFHRTQEHRRNRVTFARRDVAVQSFYYC